uniref:Uncharacterized protein n=1 Tax=Heterorhabditis bacteriophora TaxID=37862 RepID=A0A1I7WWG3_HETBA
MKWRVKAHFIKEHYDFDLLEMFSTSINTSTTEATLLAYSNTIDHCCIATGTIRQENKAQPTTTKHVTGSDNRYNQTIVQLTA